MKIGLVIVILDKQRNCLTLMSVHRLAVDYLWNLMKEEISHTINVSTDFKSDLKFKNEPRFSFE